MSAKPAAGPYVLTNTHGLRLMIVSGRVGAPPRAKSSARDAGEASGGLPLVVATPPSSLADTEGDVIALRLKPSTRARTRARLADELAEVDGEPVYASAPFALSEVSAALFRDESAATAFRAGLQTLGVEDARVPLRAAPDVFDDGLWGTPPVPTVDPGRGRLWTTHLDLQERVSSALILGDFAAASHRWSRSRIGGLRHPPKSTARVSELDRRVRTCGSVIGRIDPLRGWTSEDLLQRLEGDRGDPEMLAFVRAYVASADPFSGVEGPVVGDAVDEALAFLVDHQGLTAAEILDVVLEHSNGRPDEATAATVAPLAAALVGLSIGRSQLPQRYRPRKRDSRYISVELFAARALIAAHDEQQGSWSERAGDEE